MAKDRSLGNPTSEVLARARARRVRELNFKELIVIGAAAEFDAIARSPEPRRRARALKFHVALLDALEAYGRLHRQLWNPDPFTPAELAAAQSDVEQGKSEREAGDFVANYLAEMGPREPD